MFQAAAWLISVFYDLVNNYAIAIGMIAVAVMLLITPLTMKSTKGMLEMQRLQPEMRRLQTQYRGDRQKLNEEMMKLYQEHKVNPLASCLPLLAQMPVFIIMFRVLIKLTERSDVIDPTTGFFYFAPSYLSQDSQLYQDLSTSSEMLSFGLDLARRPIEVMGEDFVQGIPYALLVGLLAGLYYLQQKMVASRTVSPTMSPTQQKIMQYLPVGFAVFQLFFPTGLVFYYITQALFRIGQQAYITRRFYRGEESIGRQAQKASATARELAKEDGGGSGLFGLDRGAGASKSSEAKPTPKSRPTPNSKPASAPASSKRVTPPKGRPTPTSRPPTTGKGRHPKPKHPRPPRP